MRMTSPGGGGVFGGGMDKTPIQWMITPLQRYADFRGRARRAEYWWFILFVNIVYVLAFVFFIIFEQIFENDVGAILFMVVYFAMFIPIISATCRRFHDLNMSGFFVLLFLVPFGTLAIIWFMAQRGTAGHNRFGDDPLPGANLAEDFA